MPEKYLFREANIDDLSLILKWTQALMDHEALDKTIELPLSDNISELVEDWLKNLLDDNNALMILATDTTLDIPKGLIIGYLQLQPNNFTHFTMHGIIQMVWVEKDVRKQGLAIQLVHQMEDTFKNLNVGYCEIQYSDSNVEAKSFWKKVGYQEVSHSCRKIFS